MKSMDQEVNLAKLSDQRVVQTGNKHISGAILSKQGFLIEYQAIKDLSWNQAIKVNFRQLEVLISVVNRSTGPSE